MASMAMPMACAMYTKHDHSPGRRPAMAMAHAKQDHYPVPRPLLAIPKRIEPYNWFTDSEDEEEGRGYGWDAEELGLVLAHNPSWFPIFNGIGSSPSEEELVGAEEALSSGLAGLAGKIALAEMVLLQGRFEEAQSYLESVSRARDLDHAVIAQVKLGMLMENLDRLEEAGFYLRQAALVNAHEGALKLLEIFMYDHGDELDIEIPDRSGYPLGFMKDLPEAWFGRLRLGLIYKRKGNEWRANQNLFVAHQTRSMRNLLALHLKRVREVRDGWYKLISLNGELVHYPPPKPWTAEDDAKLLSRVADNDIKGVILGTRKLVSKTPIWMM